MRETDFDAVKPVIFSVAGLTLSPEERDFFEQEKPFGFILFARNVDNPGQLEKLISDLRVSVGRDTAPVLVDQEGGRVQRLRSPHWFDAPSFGKLGDLYRSDRKKGLRALELTTSLIAEDLAAVGFNVNCSPCLDLKLPETSDVIGDRSFGASPEEITLLANKVADIYQSFGITPVIKHMPGHGRGTVDSHKELPVVTAAAGDLRTSDFAPFKALKDRPWGMTAHIVFEAFDQQNPATQSATVIGDIIRGEIGFDGLLLTDDLNMSALKGDLGSRAEKSLSAGVDIVLHCSGILEEMQEVAASMAPMKEETKARVMKYHPDVAKSRGLDVAAAKQELEALMGVKG